MARREVRRAARAIREHSRRAVERYGDQPQWGTVVDRAGDAGDPELAIQVDGGMTLAATDLAVPQHLRGHDKAQAIEPGDEVLLSPVGDEWAVLATANGDAPAPDYGPGDPAGAGAGLVETCGDLAVGQGFGIVVNADDVEVDTTVIATRDYVDGAFGSLVAGAGLTRTGSTIDVGAGDGIAVAADSVAVDATVARKNIDNAFSVGQTITGQLALPTAGAGAGVLIGGDARLYRSAASRLQTPGDMYAVNFVASGFVQATGAITSTGGGGTFGGDVTARSSVPTQKVAIGTVGPAGQAGIVFRSDATPSNLYSTGTAGGAGVLVTDAALTVGPNLTTNTALKVGGVNNANRVLTVDGFGQMTARTDNNGIQNQTVYVNAGITAANQGIGFLFRLGSGNVPVDAGYVRLLSEASYSGAANQDSALAFATSLDGAVNEAMRITSQGTLQVQPLGNPTSAINVQGTITANSDVAGLLFQPTLNGTGAVGQRGVVSTPTFNTPSGTLSEATGVRVRPTFNPTTGATISAAHGVHSLIATGSGGGAISNAYAVRVDNASYGSIKPGTAYGLRVEQQGASGVTTAAGISVLAQTGATTNIGVDVGMPDGSGIRVTGSTSSNTQDLTGVLSAPTFAGTGTQNSALNLGPTYTVAGATISQGRSLVNRPTFNPGASGVITTASVYRAEPVTGSGAGSVGTLLGIAVSAPSYGTIKPTTAKAIDIGNYGASGVDTAIAVDIAGQSGATTANVGLRVALSTQAAIQLSDTGNSAAGGIQFRGLGNAANLYSNTSASLKTDGQLELGGTLQLQNNGALKGRDASAVVKTILLMGGDNTTIFRPLADGQNFRFQDSAGNDRLTIGPTSGNVVLSTGSLTAHGLTLAASSAVDLGANRATNAADPTAAQDLATKAYVDALKTGLDFKDSVRAVSTSDVSLGAQGSRTVDGVSLSSGDRVLLAGQATGSQNGIYVVNSDFSLTRAADADASAEVTAGLYAFVSEGSSNADSGWVLTTNDPITLGTTALNFTQFSGAGQIAAGAGLTKSGNTLNVGAGAGITVNADDVQISASYSGQTSITTLGTIATGTWQGAVISGTYIDTALARLASPTFTGTPAAPTAAVDTSTTQLATTAFVLGQASASGDGTPAALGTAARGSSAHYARADHVHPTTGLAVLSAANAFTDAQTITKAASSALLLRSGAAGSYTMLDLGRTAQEFALGVAGAANDFTSGSAAGDVVLKHTTAGAQLWLGVGTDANELRIQDGKIGVFNTAPAARTAAYTNSSGLSGSRTLPSGFTLNDLAKWVIQMWTDWKTYGWLQ